LGVLDRAIAYVLGVATGLEHLLVARVECELARLDTSRLNEARDLVPPLAVGRVLLLLRVVGLGSAAHFALGEAPE
jgi:hypothetical protein